MKTDWIDPPQVVKALERAADPEDLGRSRLHNEWERVRFGEEKCDHSSVVISGFFEGPERTPHEIVLTIGPKRMEGRCGCRSLRWPCSHLIALGRDWADRRRNATPTLGESANWRHVVGALAPRTRRPPVRAPGEILVHWIDLEPRRGVWALRLWWRVHKPRTRGIGRGRILPPGPLLRSVPSFAGDADRRVLEAVRAVSAEKHGTARAEAIRVEGAEVDPVLRALSRAAWVHWGKNGSPAAFSALPATIRIVGTQEDRRLTVCAEWCDIEAAQPEEGNSRVVGSSPPWVEQGGVLRPVVGVEDGQALALLTTEGVGVPERELPSFLGSAVPDLEERGIEVQLFGLEGRDFVVREVPNSRLYLSEEGGVLIGTLRFGYGDYEIEAEKPEPILGVGPAELKRFVRRDMETEFQATQQLKELGFRLVEPGRFEIAGDGAFEFLRDGLEPLAQEWEVFGRDDLRKYRVRGAPVALRVRLGVAEDWLDLSLDAEVPGDEIAVEEVLKALRRGSRYVRLGSGAHAVLASEWLGRIGASLDDLGVGKGRVRLPRHMAPVVEELLDAAPDLVHTDRESWGELVRALRDGDSSPEAPLPAGLTGILRPYQREGYRWLRFMGELGLGCILADDMGLGKTVQALAVLLAELEQGRAGPSLVVAPTSVVPNWEAEARRFAPSLRVLCYHGSDRGDLIDQIAGYHLVVTSYAILRRDVRVLAGIHWNYAILDEAQAIKNAATQTARAAGQLDARRRLALTGTPLENHLGELWSQFRFLAPGLLGTERRFLRSFVRPVAKGDLEARELLRRRVGPFILRRLKKEVARDLPEKTESVLLCEMGSEQERFYRSLLVASRERVMREMEKKGLSRARFSVLEALLRLRQACCHPEILPGEMGRGVPSAKFDVLRDFVSEIVEEGHRVLVFSQFVKVLSILRQWFSEAGIAHLYLDGRTRKREERVRRFQEDESIAAFLVSLKAGGSGLNLTAADYVILYDPWWNPAVETQATDRAHRIGQRRNVFAYKMITRGTVEEKILALQEKKREITEDLIRTGGGWSATLTEDDVEDLFRV